VSSEQRAASSEQFLMSLWLTRKSWKVGIGWWHSLSRLCTTNLLPGHRLESLCHRIKELFSEQSAKTRDGENDSSRLLHRPQLNPHPPRGRGGCHQAVEKPAFFILNGVNGLNWLKMTDYSLGSGWSLSTVWGWEMVFFLGWKLMA